ncbi:hypothetical protein OAJ50_05075 [Candidatus Nitrosopelagicus sp.]|nr:hypothetical protein [Candidatus Nitrosopelagicus sp.]
MSAIVGKHTTSRPKSIHLTGRKIIYYNELRSIVCRACGLSLKHSWVLSLRKRNYRCIDCAKQQNIIDTDFEPCGKQ